VEEEKKLDSRFRGNDEAMIDTIERTHVAAGALNA
jgi:hypothetical protein